MGANTLPKQEFVPELLPEQALKYPPTRFMGSKNKLLKNIWNVASPFEFDTVVDLFSGSGIVSYMFKSHGKAVISNDYMYMSATFAKAMVENNSVTLPIAEATKLLQPNHPSDNFVEKTFKGLPSISICAKKSGCSWDRWKGKKAC